MRLVSCAAILLALSSASFAAGHGPVFGLATPVNSEDEWSFDFGVLGRNGAGGTEVTLRSMLGYGITPHLSTYITFPAVVGPADFPVTRLAGGSEFDANLAWRFHRQAKGVGKRFESTLFTGVSFPGSQQSGLLDSLKRSPGFNAALVTGVASRSHYLWLGGGVISYLERGGDRRPNIFSYSAVYGYRPPVLRKDYPFWDWRGFLELTGERSAWVRQSGTAVPDSGAHQVFLGPSVLGIYKNYAIEGGVQFPIYRDVGSAFRKERFRFAVNVSYFLFRHGH